MASRGGSRGRRGFRANPWQAGLFLAVLVIALSLLQARERGWLGTGPDPSAARGSSATGMPAEESDGLQVYFFDVGQGDSALVRVTGEDGVRNLLIDTGEYQYADGLTDTLRSLGVERLDCLVITHPHTDHMGCAARIVQRFEIGTLAMPRVSDRVMPTTSAYEALLDAAAEKSLTAVPLTAGSQVFQPWEGLEAEVFAPRQDADWDDLNNWSGVLRLTYGETSFLFTGDAEKQSEKLILEDAGAYGWNLETDVLKCGHHGSKTSTSANFLRAVNPRYAVISCGKDNDYGHPHSGTLEKLEKLHTAVYCTDEDGTILAKSDGREIRWETGLPSIPARQWD